MSKKRDLNHRSLNDEEKNMLTSVEQGEWKRAKDLGEEMAFAKTAAEDSLRKDARVTLRLSSADLDRLKQKAAYKGLPYQTFIASVLHEYAAGHFVDVASNGGQVY